MTTLRRFVCVLPALSLLAAARAVAAPVDFAREIQPLLQEHCYECHGPDKQKNGYRLDRRSRAFSGLVRHNIIPGSSQTSRVYLRTLNTQFGMRMPPNDELSPDESELIRRWIDEGAAWPDDLANESPPPPLDAAAVDFVSRLRTGAHLPIAQRALRAQIARSPALLDQRGPGGATPLMFIALYGDAALLEAALAAGGNASARNDAGAMALHWAIDDARKVRLLLDHGAPVDAPSGIGRTPLALASALAGSDRVIHLLLERGAKPTPEALNAAARGNPRGVARLLAAGAKPTNEAGDLALRFGCSECLAKLVAAGVRLPRGLLDVLPAGGPGDPRDVRSALEYGADVHELDPKKRSPLILASVTETATPDFLRSLLDRGASLDHRALDGRNALDFAMRVGRPPVIEFLKNAGLTPTRAIAPEPKFVAGNTARAAVARAVPLLQWTAIKFYDGGGCVSCHSNTLTSMTLERARRANVGVDETPARLAREFFTSDVEATREQALQGVFAPGGMATTTGYLLMGLESEQYPATLGTDALVRLLRQSQRSDGRWPTIVRPPHESSEFTATAVALRGIRLYGDPGDPANARALRAGRRWLERNAAINTEDHVFKLLGLVWTDASGTRRRIAADELLRLQRADGGWAQLPWRASDAYATGTALNALHAAGVGTDSLAWQRGARYLLDTQLIDGSWWVRSRSLPTQSYFESGFPHGEDQFISSAATNWAVQALALEVQPQLRATASMLLPSGSSTNAP